MKKSTITKAIAAAASFALAASLTACGGQPQESAGEQIQEPEAIQIGIKLDVKAEGWNADTSTPVIAMLTPVAEDTETAANAESTDNTANAENTTEAASIAAAAEEPETLYREISCNEENMVELEAGEYELGLISPINADGSIYTVPDDTKVEAAEITEDADAIQLELIPAEQVQPAQLEGIVSAVTVAAEADPASVQAATLERAKANALANPNASAEQIEAAEDAAAEAVASGDKAAMDNAAASRPTASAPEGSNAGSGSSAPSESASTGSSTGSTQTSAPVHEHNFSTPIYSTESYLISEAYSKAACSCGTTFPSVGAWEAHVTALADEGIYNGHSWSSVYVPAQYGTRDVVVGYQCSCGATS